MDLLAHGLILNPPLANAKLSGNDMINRILIPARIFTAILSFIPDAFIFYISKKLENLQNNQMPLSLLLYSSMAYGGLLYNTRTLNTIYYTGNSMPGLNDLIIAPLRFFKYNSAPETLNKHVMVPPSRKGFQDDLLYTVWLSVVLPTLFLTLCPHKETRYVLASLPFAACLASLYLKKLKYILVLWFIYQAGLVVFWGYMHQAGILPFLQSIPANDINEVSLNVFYKTYMPPRFAFGEPQTSQISIPVECLKLAQFHGDGCQRVLDFASRAQNELLNFLDCLKIYASPNMVIRVILPGSVLPLEKSLSDYGEVLRVDTFFPHLSTENPPSLTMPNCPGDMNYMECLSAYWEILKNQLSLHSIKIALS
ncbi:hypothetical protein ACTXT7_010957 [Hymenolepis weldensis]